MLNQDLIIGANQTSLHGDVGSYYEDKYNAIVKNIEGSCLDKEIKKFRIVKLETFINEVLYERTNSVSWAVAGPDKYNKNLGRDNGISKAERNLDDFLYKLKNEMKDAYNNQPEIKEKKRKKLIKMLLIGIENVKSDNKRLLYKGLERLYELDKDIFIETCRKLLDEKMLSKNSKVYRKHKAEIEGWNKD